MGEMNTYTAGCDVGSTAGKAIILKDDRIIASAIVPSEVDPEETAQKVLGEAIRQVADLSGTLYDENYDIYTDRRVEGLSDVRDLAYLVGTGYGRNEIPFANENLSEISCHAMGVFFCDPGIKTIVDIGGQDVKGIAVDDKGGVQEFVMNDKCAAGTGRFLEMMSRSFKMNLDEFSNLSLTAKTAIPVTSQCSVFAETEVISLLSKRKSAADVAAGIQAAVAKRAFTLLKKVGVRPKVTVTGGCSKNKGLIKAIENRLRMEIVALPVDPQLMGALGAAVIARRRIMEGKVTGKVA